MASQDLLRPKTKAEKTVQSEQNTVRNLINSHISYLKHIVKNASRRNSSKYWNRFVTTRFHEKNLATMTKARKTTMTTRSVQPEQTQRCGIWLIFIFLTSVGRFFFLMKLTCHKVVISFWRVFWQNQTLSSVSTRNLSRCVNRFVTTCIHEKNNPHL